MSTFLPFLYETQTILGRRSIRHVARRSTFTTIHIAPFSSSRSCNDIPWEDGAVGSGFGARGGPRRGPRKMVEKPTRYHGQESDGYKSPYVSRSIFAKPEDTDGSFGSSYVPQRVDKDSTITIAEKRAFDDIFSSIRARSARLESEGSIDPLTGQNLFSVGVDKNPVETLNDIMHAAIQAGKIDRKSPTKGLRRQAPVNNFRDSEVAEDQMKSFVGTFPKPLRNKAQAALYSQARLVDLGIEDPNSDADTERLQQPERERIEKLMRGANTDVELWNVMEAEVFSLVSKLGLEAQVEVELPKAKKSSSGAKKGDTKVAVSEKESQKAAAKQASDLTILGPLYPLFLVLGVRLLSGSFSKPSPLVQSVLPRIKSLGRLSHALGASTPLYNDLIRISFARYDDIPGALKLLDEMDQAGIDLDLQTQEVIEEILQTQQRMKTFRGGEAMMALGFMPGWTDTMDKFVEWQARVQDMITKRREDDQRRIAWSAAHT